MAAFLIGMQWLTNLSWSCCCCHCTLLLLLPLCNRQLKVLRLGWNMLGPKGAKALAEGLKYCSSGLEQLYLPWSGITDTGASHIAKVCEAEVVVAWFAAGFCSSCQ